MLLREVKKGNRQVDLVIEEPGFRRLLVEIKKGIRSQRDLRDQILNLAILLNENPSDNGRLVLVNPAIKDERILTLWRDALSTVKQVIADRLSLMVIQDGLTTVGKGLAANDRIEDELVREFTEAKSSDIRMDSPRYAYVILKILITRWIRDQDYISAKDLAAISGSSYPTVKKAVDRFDQYIERGPKNALRLARFPSRPFSEMVARGSDVRYTLHFVDVSGRHKSPTALAERLGEIETENVAIGGVIAARHWWPKLDIVGTPRLDLSVHAPGSHINVDFVRLLDPALKASKGDHQNSSVAIHAVRRAESGFERSQPQLPLADPAECLLDLFEMGYTAQATEWLESLKWINSG